MSQSRSNYHRRRLRQRSLGLIVLLFLGAFMLASGTILAFYFIPNPDLLLSSKGGEKPAGNRLVHLSFLGSDFYVPQSILKRAKRRMLGTVEQIDVQIPWPYDHLAVISGTVELTGDIRNWVLLTFVPNPDRVPPDERVATSDRYYFAGPGEKDSSGLTRYDYKPRIRPTAICNSMFRKARPGSRRVIRCDLNASSLGPILCEREVQPRKRSQPASASRAPTSKTGRTSNRISRRVIRALLRNQCGRRVVL